MRTPLLAVLLLAAALPLTACGTPAGTVSPALAAQSEAPLTFAQWVAALRREALAQGIRPATFDRAFDGVQPRERVVTLDRSQPEFARQVWQYLDSAASDRRVRDGQAKIAANRALLTRIARRSGVPAEVLVAFWGIETDYGAATGGFPVIAALATLAYEGRRAAYFKGELLAALHILDSGDIALERMDGSWAGAMGQTQFMPTVFLKHAVDEDRDGRRDIWDSLPDVFASTADFVRANGWKPGERWGEEVVLPAGFPYDQAELSIVKPVAEWARMGVRTVAGHVPAGSGNAAILVLAGHRGPAFLVRDNFRAIMRYNPSTSYALAVAVLSDRLAGRPGIRGTWPRDERGLSQDERTELQQRLSDLGHNPGGIDGIIGANTRQAIRRFQNSQGLVPDGFATVGLLSALRAH